MATLNKESIYETATDSTCANPAAKDTAQGKSKVVICSAAILAGIILLIVLSSCFIALFIEITKLKTKLESTSLTTPQSTTTTTTTSQPPSTVLGSTPGPTSATNEQFGTQETNFSALILTATMAINSSIESFKQQVMEQVNTSLIMQGIDISSLQVLQRQQNASFTELSNALAGEYELYPASSCAALPSSFPSGYYWVRASSGSAVRVYCGHDQVMWWSHWRLDESGLSGHDKQRSPVSQWLRTAH